MKFLIFLAGWVLALAMSFSDFDLNEWNLFKDKHKKVYKTEAEENYRMKIFMENKHMINLHNAKYESGDVTYKLGINKYADMLQSEVSAMLNGLKLPEDYNKTGTGPTFVPPANVVLPDYVNWVESGAVTPVKDQGFCGSCWAFGSTGALEGQHFRKTGVLVSLSEQNLVDCCGKKGSRLVCYGCEGGWPEDALEYIRINHGIDTEDSYPYEARDDKCRFDPNNVGATDTGVVKVPSENSTALKSAVATVGPIAVSIQANLPSFNLYTEGIYNDPNCTKKGIDHAVLVVGYGTDNTTNQDYWLIKNSWGVDWGEKGYIKILRSDEDICGVTFYPVYPLV